jgi:hypothetical protein
VIVGGIDTHKDLHVAAVLDTTGVVLATGPPNHNRNVLLETDAWSNGNAWASAAGGHR